MSVALGGFKYRDPEYQVFGNAWDVSYTAKDMLQRAEAYATQLGYFAASITPPKIEPNFPTLDAAPLPITAPLPVLQKINWVVPLEPGSFDQNLDLSDIKMPALTATPPVLNFGTQPQADYGAAPDSPSVDLNFSYPDLNLTLPLPPSLMTIDTVKFDGVTLPTFDATVPTLTAVQPNVVHFDEGNRYTSTLLGMLETDLTSALSGGSGLPAAAEQGLFDRARERELRTQAEALADLERMESLGYQFPPGVYLDARIKIQTETDNTLAGLSRDIMVKQAELQLENLVKARETATTLEGRQIEYSNQIAQRTFEAAKYQTEAGISLYNAAVKAFEVEMQAYATQGQVYGELIKGALAIVEVFKAEIEAEKVKADINHDLVLMYSEQVKAQLAYVDIYKAQLGAIETKANIQKLKVEVFGEQIKAYTGRIGAFSAEVEAYKAGISAQGAIEQAYSTQVTAYKSQVDAGVAQVTARVDTYKAQIAAYQAKLDAYKADLSAMTEQVRSASLYNTAAADVYKAEISGLSSYNQTLTEQWKAVADIAEKEAEVGVKAAEAQGQMYVTTKEIAAKAVETGGQMLAQLGAAAFSAIHFSASASWASSGSQSYAESVAVSQSASTSENTNHNESV